MTEQPRVITARVGEFGSVSDDDAKRCDELSEQIYQLIYVDSAQPKPESKPQVIREIKAMLANSKGTSMNKREQRQFDRVHRRLLAFYLKVWLRGLSSENLKAAFMALIQRKTIVLRLTLIDKDAIAAGWKAVSGKRIVKQIEVEALKKLLDK